jgi:hypothetical protein
MVNNKRGATVLPFDRSDGNRTSDDLRGDTARASLRNATDAGDIGPMCRPSG